MVRKDVLCWLDELVKDDDFLEGVHSRLYARRWTMGAQGDAPTILLPDDARESVENFTGARLINYSHKWLGYRGIYPLPIGHKSISRWKSRIGVSTGLDITPLVDSPHGYLGLAIRVDGPDIRRRAGHAWLLGICHPFAELSDEILAVLPEAYFDFIETEGRPDDRFYRFTEPAVQIEYATYPDNELDKRLKRTLTWYRRYILGNRFGGRNTDSSYDKAHKAWKNGSWKTHKEGFDKWLDLSGEKKYLDQNPGDRDRLFENFKQRMKERRRKDKSEQ